MTVKTYPNPSAKHIETVCTAGVIENKGFIRLYPVPFRMLEGEQRFKRYTWVQVPVKRARDPRPESHYPDCDRLEVGETVDTKNGWAERKRIILPHLSQSVEELQERQKMDGTSLGIIRPKEVIEFTMTPCDQPEWTEEELAKLKQQTLFERGPVTLLEKIPVEFRYRFVCDDPRCKGQHHMRVWDWEVAESYRNWKVKYPGPDAVQQAMLQKFNDELVGKCDLHFFMGTMAAHQHVWTIVGLFYPRRT